MGYNSDKEVVFSFLRRVDYNDTWENIEYQLGYDFGDYRFGNGDSEELRKKIKRVIKQIKLEFEGVFNEDNNTRG